jgi:hypothetical protein
MAFFPPDQITPPQAVSSSGSTVLEKFEQAQQYADEAWTESWSLLDQLKSLQYDIVWDPIEIPALDLMGLDGLGMEEPTEPDINGDIAVAMPELTEQLPELGDITIDTETPPEMNISDPGFNIPAAPTDEFPIFSENAPDLSAIDYPTKPDLNLPAVPQLTSISIPSPPEYSIADFEGTLPSMDLTPPEPAFTFSEAPYASDVKDELAAKLLADLQTGGSGLNAATEHAIYDRALSRQETENEKVITDTLNLFASRGFVLPPGALSGAIIEAEARVAQIREDLNNDILIQQSKLAQDNTQFTVNAAIEQEKGLMGLHNQVQQRAFEVARYTVEAAVTIYGIKVEAYKAQLEVYKAMAQVYEARIRAETVKAELYRAQIAGIQAVVDVDKARIDAYQAQVQGISILIELYRAEMEGARVRAEVDRTRVQAFGALVEAYTAQIQAVTAKYETYRYQIEGEKAKADMYGAQVDAYEAQVQAYKARADVDVSRAQAEVELNRGRVDSYRAAIERYRAQVQAAIADTETQIKIEELDVSVYESQIRRYQAEVDATVRALNARVEDLKNRIELEIKEADVATRTALSKYEMTTESIRSAARVAGQLAASAMASVSASADISHRENRSDSTSASASMSSSSSSSRSVSVSNVTITNK